MVCDNTFTHVYAFKSMDLCSTLMPFSTTSIHAQSVKEAEIVEVVVSINRCWLE